MNDSSLAEFLTPHLRSGFESVATKAEAARQWPTLHTLHQVHGATGVEVKKTSGLSSSEGDFLYTFDTDCRLGIFVADCTAVLWEGQAKRGPFIAALHAGWRGSAAHLFERAWKLIEPEKGSRAWLSPSICQEHFEVGEEVVQAFGEAGRRFSKPHSVQRQKHLLDLKALQREMLKTLGVSEIFASPLCTYCEKDLFSYRRSKGTLEARHLAWIERS